MLFGARSHFTWGAARGCSPFGSVNLDNPLWLAPKNRFRSEQHDELAVVTDDLDHRRSFSVRVVLESSRRCGGENLTCGPVVLAAQWAVRLDPAFRG